MHFSRSTHRLSFRAAALALPILLLGVAGCPKQEDFPVALDLDVPPTPFNFVISNAGTNYTFAWEVSDPAAVDHYLVYLLGGGLAPNEVIIETALTSVTYDVGFSLAGLQFAVSAVSAQGVEGEWTVRAAQ
ncbi:MAG TPA: hypothetical protein VEC56_12040 [Candidatus Krumholzibacteria bacterium]|nr:hypothetical protein [Candidatus Krumholzibacteria bacterium]